MVAKEQPVAPDTGRIAEDGPYKFLDYFADTPEDRRRFGGREREIRELVARIASEWTLVLYGRSGIGKTSLLLAGIFPELEARGHRPVYARTLTDPIRDLCKAINDRCGTADPQENLRATVEQATAGGPLVIVLDQFEEFFIRFRDKPEVRANFVRAVASLVNDQSLDVTVVFSLREDYLADLDDFRAKIPDLFEHQYRLRALTAFGVRQAISKPLIDAGIPHEDAVVSQLVDQLEDSGFDPPVLQIICSELYREAASRTADIPRITLDDVKKVGDLDDIFRRCLDGLAKAIPEERTLLARMILDALITGENTKQAVTLKDLLTAEFSAQEDEIHQILEILVQQRLLRRQLRDGQPWYELIHERLVPHLKKWLDSDPRFYEFRQARDFVQTNCKSDLWVRKPEALLNAGVLTDLLGPYKERFRFQKRELEFIFRSAVYRHSSDVAFWAERFDLQEAITLVLELAASPLAENRIAAAVAARHLADPEGRLAALCLELALKDPSSEVQRQSGLSLAKIAREEEIEALRQAMRRRETRRAARQTLTDLLLGGHSLQQFSWLRRRFAREGAERRLQGEHRELIRARQNAGIAQGPLAALVWSILLCCPYAAFLLGLASDGPEWSLLMAATLGFSFPIAAGLGALLGGIVASAAAADTVTRGVDGRWLRAIAKSRPLFYGMVGLAILGMSARWLMGIEDPVRSLLGVLEPAGMALVMASPLAVLFSSGLGLLLQASRPAVWPAESRSQIWLWSFLASTGIVGLGTGAATLVLFLSSTEGLDSGQWPFIPLPALLVGLLVFTSLVAILGSEYRFPLRKAAEPSVQKRWWSRAIVITGTFLGMAWAGYFLELDMIPAFAEDVRYDPVEGLLHKHAMGPRNPDKHYFRTCVPKGPVRFTEPQLPNDYSRFARLNGNLLGGFTAEILVLPPGCHLTSLELDRSTSAPEETELRLTPLPLLQAEGGTRHLRSGDVVLSTLVLRRPAEKSKVWAGSLHGELPDAWSLGPENKIVVSPQWYRVSGLASREVQVQAFARSRRGLTPISFRTLSMDQEALYRDEKEAVTQRLSPEESATAFVQWHEAISPAITSPKALYWTATPDRQGRWHIEFQVKGIVPNGERPLIQIEIPVLLHLADTGQPSQGFTSQEDFERRLSRSPLFQNLERSTKDSSDR